MAAAGNGKVECATHGPGGGGNVGGSNSKVTTVTRLVGVGVSGSGGVVTKVVHRLKISPNSVSTERITHCTGGSICVAGVDMKNRILGTRNVVGQEVQFTRSGVGINFHH